MARVGIVRYMAETPPPFTPMAPQAPKQGMNPLVWILLAMGAACCVCIIAGVVMTVGTVNQVGSFAGCPMTMGMLNNSLKEYVKENGVFPKAETWQTDVEPYYTKQYAEFKSKMEEAGPFETVFRISPPGEALVCYEGNKAKTGIVYNSEIAGKKLEDFEDIDKEVTLFEGDSVELNAHGVYSIREGKSEQEIFGQVRDYYSWEYGDNFETDGSSSGFKIETN